MIIDETYRNNPKCPCGNNKILNDCHGKHLHALIEMPYMKQYINIDFEKMLHDAKEQGEISDIRPFSKKRRRNKVKIKR